MISQNNDGNYYEIAVDTAKEGAEVWSLNNWFKARVGDDGTPLVMRFYTQGQLNSFDGHQKPIIEGNVGAYSFDENKQIVMAADAKVVSWTGDPSDMLPGGRVRYHFPQQMFPTEGAFYGFMGYVDESNGRRLTGVNVWFRVLGGVAQMGKACDYYISDLDIALANAKEKMRQAGIDFKAATDSALQDLRTKYQQEAQANQDASETTRAGLSKLADSVGAIQAQIDAGNVVTLKAFNDSSAELMTRQNNLEYAINEKLSQMRTAPRGIASLSSLQSKYPSGDDNLYVTVDTGHWYYWDGSAWSDGGVYQTQATDQTVIDKATDANDLAAGMSLISNGSFSNGEIDPAFSSGQATLSVTEYAGQKWLKVVADGSNASQGFAYTLTNIDGRLKSPIHINFTYQSSITQELSLYLIGYDASGKQLFYNEIEKYNAANWFFEKVDVYKKIVLPSDISFEQLDHVTLAFSSTHATSFVMLIGQVKVSIEALVHHKPGKNLIKDSIKFDSTSGIDALTKETNLQVANYLGRKWLKITSSSIDKYQGAGWRIPTYNREIFANPLHIKFDMQSSVNQTLALDVHYFDNADKDLGYQNVASIDCKKYGFKEIDEFVKLIAPPSGEVSYVKLMLFNPSSSSIGTLLIEPLSVTLDFPAESYKGVLIPNGDFYNGDTRPASANTSDTQLQVVNVMGKKWLKITSSGTTRYRGVYWTIEDDKTASAFTNPIHLCMTVQSSIKQTLGISIHLFKADGTDLGSINYSDDLNLNPYQTIKYSHDILLTPKNGINPEDVDHFTILLSTSGTEDLGTILVTDVKANIKIFDSPSNDDVSYSSLPTVYLDGDTSSMSGDTYVTMKFRYINRKQVVSGYASAKWQGDSSLAWPKKAYRIKTYYDKDLKQKMNFRPLSTWDKSNKFNLKACYNDPTLAKDVVNAQIGAAIWSTESHIPTQMEHTNAYGFIVGFPVQVYVNNIFYGIFNFNTTKGDYPYAKYVVAGKVYSDATTFRSLPDGGVKLDGSDFEMVSPDDPDDTIKKLMNDAISFVSTSSDDDFKKKFGNYFDKESVIDYLIFNNIVDNGDAWAKNQTFVTWDGQKLYMHPYDLDASLGGDYDGSLVGPANAIRGVGNAGMSYHKLFKRVNELFNDDVRARYKNLRTWLTPDYTTTKFKNYMEKIGEGNYLREFAKWDNPNHDQNTFNYIKYNLIESMKICDRNWLN